MRVNLFDDDIGAVEYVSHMGTDLSAVNAARVSFGTEKQEVDENLNTSNENIEDFRKNMFNTAQEEED